MELAINPFRPDVVMKQTKYNPHRYQTVFVEVQRSVDTSWVDKIEANYMNSKVIIIELKKINKEIEGKEGLEVLNTIDMYVAGQLDTETMQTKKKSILDDPPKSKSERRRYKENCEWCGHSISLYGIAGHRKTCKKNPANKKEPRW